ncbi:hypothetical protein FMEAI12_3820014 [Parafrankia sp. Ea1.12]|nr:hypothetical protein FMEAI12_3820014 [Parafrankia sp. Ea1.12]
MPPAGPRGSRRTAARRPARVGPAKDPAGPGSRTPRRTARPRTAARARHGSSSPASPYGTPSARPSRSLRAPPATAVAATTRHTSPRQTDRVITYRAVTLAHGNHRSRWTPTLTPSRMTELGNGVLKDGACALRISVIVRALTDGVLDYATDVPRPRAYVLPDGRMDFIRLLTGFAAFWKATGDILVSQQIYHEAAPHLVLQAYLQRVVNGGGTVLREYGVGRGRRRPPRLRTRPARRLPRPPRPRHRRPAPLRPPADGSHHPRTHDHHRHNQPSRPPGHPVPGIAPSRTRPRGTNRARRRRSPAPEHIHRSCRGRRVADWRR